jgi:hypothetical protein
MRPLQDFTRTQKVLISICAVVIATGTGLFFAWVLVSAACDELGLALLFRSCQTFNRWG